MKKIPCFLFDFEPYGVFIGCQLLLEDQNLEQNYNKILKSIKFYNTVNEQLEKFLEIYTYSIEKVEKWFQRFEFIFKFMWYFMGFLGQLEFLSNLIVVNNQMFCLLSLGRMIMSLGLSILDHPIVLVVQNVQI